MMVTTEELEEVARAVSGLGVTWLEEPLPVEDRESYARLREKGIVPSTNTAASAKSTPP